MLIAVLAATAVAALPAAPASADAQLHPAAAGRVLTEEASAGDISAVFTDHNDSTRGELWLTVERRGELLFDGPVVPEGCERGFCDQGGFGRFGPSLRVADLDGDSILEVALTFYTGGAHCCFGVQVYRQASDGGYEPGPERDVGNPPVAMRDLDGDGRLELVTGDDRFAYKFTGYALSGFPLRVWTYERGRLRNRTRSQRAAARVDAARWWHEYRRRRGRMDARGVFAAWAADTCLLGRCGRVRRELARGVRRGWLDSGPAPFPGFRDTYPAGRAHARSLLRFLARTGYRYAAAPADAGTFRNCGDLDEGVGVKNVRSLDAGCESSARVARRWQRRCSLKLRCVSVMATDA